MLRFVKAHRILLAVGVGFLGFFTHAPAHADGSWSVLAHNDLPGWAAFRVTVPVGGGSIIVANSFDLGGAPNGEEGVWLTGGSRDQAFAVRFATDSFIRVRASVAALPEVTIANGPRGGLGTGSFWGRFDVDAGTYEVVVAVAAPGVRATGSVDVSGSPGTAVTGSTSGSDVVLKSDDDERGFNPALGAFAAAVIPSADVAISGNEAVSFDHQAFAHFLTWNFVPSVNLTRLIRPDGTWNVSETGGGGHFLSGGGSGTYNFTIDVVAHVTPIGRAAVTMLTADVTPP